MSEITGKEFSEGFKMRVVSGMLVDGSIQVSWATGKKASSQMDWGLDPENLATTPEYHREPSEMLRYHTLYFPITYLDARHYFRVRSKTAGGQIGQSRIYSVITPDDVQRTTQSPTGQVILELQPIDDHEDIFFCYPETSIRADHQPEATSQTLTSELHTDENVSELTGAASSNATTNPITIIT
ncbi:hypothetical protein [Fodinibius sp. Rm-B-1B1-1]|uniref:hypothetical protein n=1 Tax=Fodinibius alkaliphilus TaxID=3140241 RepID=UPI00315B2662